MILLIGLGEMILQTGDNGTRKAQWLYVAVCWVWKMPIRKVKSLGTVRLEQES
jgi:hypothetical protein